jgi:hypothetical protein
MVYNQSLKKKQEINLTGTFKNLFINQKRPILS